MNKNEEITKISGEILLDITENRMPLNIILLKCSRLALLLDLPQSVEYYKNSAEYSESNSFTIETFRNNIEAAKDSDVSEKGDGSLLI